MAKKQRLTKKDRNWLIVAIQMMASTVVYLHDSGEEHTMYRYLFLIEEYKDLLENA
jgi:hypothetical protein